MKKLLFCLIFTFNSYALTLAKIDVSDKKTIAGKQLLLNGAGIRKATWLKVKVYVGSLYVATKSKDPTILLSQKGPKYLNMHFVRSVGKEKLVGGWNEAFERSLSKADLKKYKTSIKTFNESIQDMKNNDLMELTFYKDRLEYSIKNKKYPPISQKGFADKVLSVWFINAEDRGLKEGLLGK